MRQLGLVGRVGSTENVTLDAFVTVAPKDSLEA